MQMYKDQLMICIRELYNKIRALMAILPIQIIKIIFPFYKYLLNKGLYKLIFKYFYQLTKIPSTILGHWKGNIIAFGGLFDGFDFLMSASSEAIKTLWI